MSGTLCSNVCVFFECLEDEVHALLVLAVATMRHFVVLPYYLLELSKVVAHRAKGVVSLEIWVIMARFGVMV